MSLNLLLEIQLEKEKRQTEGPNPSQYLIYRDGKSILVKDGKEVRVEFDFRKKPQKPQKPQKIPINLESNFAKESAKKALLENPELSKMTPSAILDTLPRHSLQELCADLGIKGRSKLNKSQTITLLSKDWKKIRTRALSTVTVNRNFKRHLLS
jgi:hypothetical protein